MQFVCQNNRRSTHTVHLHCAASTPLREVSTGSSSREGIELCPDSQIVIVCLNQKVWLLSVRSENGCS